MLINKLLFQSIWRKKKKFYIDFKIILTSLRSVLVLTADEQSTQVININIELRNWNVTDVFLKSFESIPGKTDINNDNTNVWPWEKFDVCRTIWRVIPAKQVIRDVKRCGSVMLSIEEKSLKINIIINNEEKKWIRTVQLMVEQ